MLCIRKNIGDRKFLFCDVGCRPSSQASFYVQYSFIGFSDLLSSLENLKEGDHAHLECRVEPINDPNLKIEWFVNGVAIKTGHRFRTTHDFGYVALDVLYTYADDSGTYMAKATNLLGEAVNTCQITVGGKIHVTLLPYI